MFNFIIKAFKEFLDWSLSLLTLFKKLIVEVFQRQIYIFRVLFYLLLKYIIKVTTQQGKARILLLKFRLKHYPITIFYHYILLSIADFILAGGVHIMEFSPNFGSLSLYYTLWSIILIYHIYFWISLYFIDLHYWVYRRGMFTTYNIHMLLIVQHKVHLLLGMKVLCYYYPAFVYFYLALGLAATNAEQLTPHLNNIPFFMNVYYWDTPDKYLKYIDFVYPKRITNNKEIYDLYRNSGSRNKTFWFVGRNNKKKSWFSLID